MTGSSAYDAGYEKYLREFAKLIRQLASPKWKFDDATFDCSAASFDNPDGPTAGRQAIAVMSREIVPKTSLRGLL